MGKKKDDDIMRLVFFLAVRPLPLASWLSKCALIDLRNTALQITDGLEWALYFTN